jgi:hypothetical protein
MQEIGSADDRSVPPTAVAFEDRGYWRTRRQLVYLDRFARLVRSVARDAKSIVDVGTRGCPYLEWFDWIPRRVSIDLSLPYQSPGVDGIKGNFLDWVPDTTFDFCTCLQVLEHLNDPTEFAAKLKATANQLIVSVPYMWPEGHCVYHVQDPVDEDKFAGWFGRRPDLLVFAAEKPGRKHPQGLRRMIGYFDLRIEVQ